MRYRLFLNALLVAVLVSAAGCSRAVDPWAATPPGQKRILASFTPIYCLTANVAKEHAKVLCLTTAEGPHDYAPTPSDAVKVAGADLFVTNGLDLDDQFADRLLKMARTKNAEVFALGEEIDHDLLEHTHEDGHDHKDHGHKHGDHDPHIWLGLPQARAMVDVIAVRLGKSDPANKAAFEKNAKDYITKLDELEAYGKKKLEGKKNRAIVTMHESLAYFAKTFKLEVAGSIRKVADKEADARHMAKVIEICKQKNVGVIAVEPQYPRRQADAIVKVLQGQGLEVEIVEIDTIETAPPGSGSTPAADYYYERMKKNIDNLAKALK